MADVVTIGNVDDLAAAIAAKLGVGRGELYRGGAPAPARGRSAAAAFGGGPTGAQAGDGGASVAANATTAWGQASDAAGGYGSVLSSIGPLAGAAGSALNQSLKNALETGAQITKSLANLPEVTAGFFDYYSVYIDSTDDLARAFGDMGGAAGEGSKEFNTLNNLMYDVAQNFDSATFAGRRLQDMGFDNMEMFKSFNEVFSETQMLSRLPMWENLTRGSPEAREQAQKALVDMTMRMGIFQKQMGLTEEQAQTFYDVAITRSGEASENLLVDTSIISKAFGEQGFNMKKVGQEMSNLMSDYDMFGHLAPMAAAKAAAAAEKMAIPAEALAKSAEGLQSYEGAAAAISKLSMYAGVPIDLQADELMRLAIEDPAEAVMSVMDSLQRAGVDVNDLGILQQRAMAKAMNMQTDTFLRAANASATGGLEAVRSAVEGAQSELDSAGEAAAGSQRAMAERAAQDAATVIERGAPRAAMDLKPQEEAMNVLRRQTARQSTEIAKQYIKVTQDANSTVRSMVSNAIQANQETIQEGARATSKAIQAVRGETAVVAAGGIARGRAPEAGQGAARLEAFMAEIRAVQRGDRELFASDEDVAALAANYLALRQTIQNSTTPSPELQQAAADMRALAKAVGVNVSGATVQEALQQNFGDIDLTATMDGIGTSAISGIMDAMISDMEEPGHSERFRGAFKRYIDDALEIDSPSQLLRRIFKRGQPPPEAMADDLLPDNLGDAMERKLEPEVSRAREMAEEAAARAAAGPAAAAAVVTTQITADVVKEMRTQAAFGAEETTMMKAALDKQLSDSEAAAETTSNQLKIAEEAMGALGDASGVGEFTDAQIAAQGKLSMARRADAAARQELVTAKEASAALTAAPAPAAPVAEPVEAAAEQRRTAVIEAEAGARAVQVAAVAPAATPTTAPAPTPNVTRITVVEIDGREVARAVEQEVGGPIATIENAANISHASSGVDQV